MKTITVKLSTLRVMVSILLCNGIPDSTLLTSLGWDAKVLLPSEIWHRWLAGRFHSVEQMLAHHSRWSSNKTVQRSSGVSCHAQDALLYKK